METTNIQYIGTHSLLSVISMASQLYNKERINAFPQFEELDTIFAFLDELKLELCYHLSLKNYCHRNSQDSHYLHQFIQHYALTRQRKKTLTWHFNCLLDMATP